MIESVPWASECKEPNRSRILMKELFCTQVPFLFPSPCAPTTCKNSANLGVDSELGLGADGAKQNGSRPRQRLRTPKGQETQANQIPHTQESKGGRDSLPRSPEARQEVARESDR